jgi:hypothetical protein
MRTLLACFLILTFPGFSAAWGEKAHLMINRLAIDRVAPQLPEFMKYSRATIIYNGYEPDRWREEANSPMQIAEAPEHFLNTELWGAISTLEPDRYAFMNSLVRRKVDLRNVGYLPYAILENYGRLKNAFRQTRKAATAQDAAAAQADAIHYAGVLGHYVADASQPLHTSIHFNGWLDSVPNPKNFTRDRMLHSRYESGYVNRALEDSIVIPKMVAPRRLRDVSGAIKEHLQQTFMDLEPMYELEKGGEFNPEMPRTKGTAFIATELARAATMLSSLWYTAWLESGDPVPPTPDR